MDEKIVQIAEGVIKSALELEVNKSFFNDKLVRENLHPLVNDELQRNHLIGRYNEDITQNSTHNALINLGYYYENYTRLVPRATIGHYRKF